MDKSVFKRKVLPLFSISLVSTFAGVYVGFQFLFDLLQSYVFLGLVVLWVALLFVVYFTRSIKWLFLFTFAGGLVISPSIYVALQVSPLIVVEAFGITSVVFSRFVYMDGLRIGISRPGAVYCLFC